MEKQAIISLCRAVSMSAVLAVSSLAFAVTETKGPNGESATPYSQVKLSEVEKNQVRAAGYTAAQSGFP
ncbi:hypothetical protein RAL05_002273 [Vibrio vulnificus]|nr:hypothetical protein [Vibrio vulnificus]